MIWRIRIGKWRITFSFAPIVDVVGVNSNLNSGEHILMWDFDGVNKTRVIMELQHVQRVYDLPNIYILETKHGKNYIAYCFKRYTWRKAVEIIAYTKMVDPAFFKYGVYREHFTLRVTPKNKRRPKLIHILRSAVQEDVKIPDLNSWVQYETIP